MGKLVFIFNLEIEIGFKRIHNSATKAAIIAYYCVEGTVIGIL